MDVQQIDFIPKQTLDQLTEELQLALRPAFDTDFNEIRDLPIEIQRAEASEALGIAQFYYGSFSEALDQLEQSLSYTNTLERRGSQRITYVKLLIALARFRVGEPDKATKELENVADLCVANNNIALATIAYTNLAISCSRVSKHSEAERFSKQAIDYSLKLHHRASFEHLQHVRILIAIYIRAAEYAKADTLIDNHGFGSDEKKLLQAGLYYSVGQIDKAIAVLESFDHDDESSITSVGDLQHDDDNHDISTQQRNEPTAPGELLKASSALSSSSVASEYDLNQESPLIRHIIEVEKHVNKALVAFNSVMIRGGGFHDLLVPLRMIESFVAELRKRKVMIDRASVSASLLPNNDANLINQNPYLKYKWNEIPDFLSSDIYFFPVITWSTILVAQTESRLLAYQFSNGLKIENSDVVPVFANSSVPGNDAFIDAISNAYKQALAVIDACQFSTLSPPSSTMTGITATTTPGGAAGVTTTIGSTAGNEIVFQDSSQLSVHSGSIGGGHSVNSDIHDAIALSQQQLPLSLDATTIEPQVKDSVDITIAKDQANSMQLLSSISNCNDPVNNIAANAALKILKNHGIDIDPNTGSFAITVAASPVQSPIKKGKKSRGGKGSLDLTSKPGTAAASTPNKPSPKVSRVSSANPTGAPASGVGSPSGVSSPKPLHAVVTAMTAFATAAAAPPPPPVAPPYLPNKIDKLSSRSELIPYIEKFGRDEVAAFIQWSIANMNGGMSLGTFGQSVASAQELLAFIEHEKNQLLLAISSKSKDPNDPNSGGGNEPGITIPTTEPTTPSAKVRAAALLQEKVLPRSQEFLREVRNRLAEIDTKLSLQLHAGFTEIYFKVYGNEPIINPNDHSHGGGMDDDGHEGGNGGGGGGEDDLSSGNKLHAMLINKFSKIDPFPIGLLESHVIIVMLLMKLSSQLGMKQEVETHLNHYDRMSTLLYYRKPYSIDAQVYYALSFRWKLDLLEWLTDRDIFEVHNEVKRQQLYFQQFLPLAKKYYQAAKKIGNNNNKNHSFGIGGMASTGGNGNGGNDGDYHIQKDALKRLINIYLVINRDSSMDNYSQASRLTGNSVTMDDLLKFGQESIAYYEETDLDWVKKYGKLRAMQFMGEMKEISRKCASM